MKEESKLIHTQILNDWPTPDWTDKWFEDSKYFEWHHDQECCERVYIDNTHAGDYIKQIEQWSGAVNKIEYWSCPWEWFLTKLYNKEDKYLGHIYYPCYNSQNWWYSSDLELVILPEWKHIDISDFVKAIEAEW